MREEGGKRFYSATDLVNYLGCSHATVLDLRQLAKPVVLAEDDEQAKLLQEKGLAHEKAYLARLRKEGLTVAEISDQGSLDARVGTVDKLQGQEAAVVLISMTTSSGDDMPRNIEFLYSRNRLNVAISRARCLSVIFASPRLLEIPCHTIEQMQLVNTLCWAKDYSRRA